MIPTIELAQESFQEIFEKSRKRISILYPQWTNFNTNDTGIALLELLSWLKEVQDFHLNQIGEEHLRMYLKLMGMRPMSVRPAHAVVHCFQVEWEEVLPKGYVFRAGDITFQSEESVRLYPGKLLKLTVTDKTGNVLNEQRMDEMDRYMHFPVFGIAPQIGNCMEMIFDQPFTMGEVFGLYFSVYEDYEIKRNPISEEFIPFTGIYVEYKTKAGWKKCQIQRDDTAGFLKSGILHIQIPFVKKENLLDSYCIRIRMEWGEYDVVPYLNYLNLNPIPLIQCKTIAESGMDALKEATFIYEKTEHGYKETNEIKTGNMLYSRVIESVGTGVLGHGNGFPNQSFSIGFSGVLEDSVEILVEHPEYPAVFEIWERVPDFGASSPEDRHFVVDEIENRICFGDNIRGFAPEGEIRLLAAMQTEGILGNVKKRQIHVVPASENEPLFFKALNEENVLDGARQETLEECFERFQKEVREVDYAATEEDFVHHILHTPGLLLEKANVVEVDTERNVIYAAVKPWSEEECPELSDGYYQNIMHHMNGKRLIGTDFRIMELEYIQITLYMELEMRVHYRDVNELIRERLKRYFDVVQSEFGQPILYSELYGFLDSMQDVARVYSLTIDASGQGLERNISGDVILPPNGLANLRQVQCSVFYSK